MRKAGSGNEVFLGVVDSYKPGKGEATVLFANRPGETPFYSGYLVLVEKGGRIAVAE